MNSMWLLLSLGGLTFCVSALLFWISLPFVHLLAVSVPNKRSAHVGLIPQAGGVIIYLSISFVMMLLAFQGQSYRYDTVLLYGALLTFIGWVDDRFQLTIFVRLMGYSACITGYLITTLEGGPDVSRAYWVEIFFIGFVILVFVNFANFMDGMDGMIAFGFAPILCFVCILSLFEFLPQSNGIFASLALGALAAFAFYNKPPARIFLGDAGSVLLGFFIAVLLLDSSQHIGVVAALIPSLYFICDPGITLIKRIFRGERFWEAHRQHYYQQAFDAGLSTWSIIIHIGICNAILCCLAYLAIRADLFWSFLFLVSALSCVTFLLNSLGNKKNV